MNTIPSRPGFGPNLAAFASFGRGWRLRRLVLSLPRLLLLWQERAEQRYALAGLDRRLLADLGLDPTEVARELAKPFWRA